MVLMDKKGVMWSHLAEAIIGLAIIAIVGTLAYEPLVKPTLTALGLQSQVLPDDESEFVPYRTELTEDEGILLDSVNALRCGLNSVAEHVSDASQCTGLTQKATESTPTGATVFDKNSKYCIAIDFLDSRCYE